MKKRSALEQVIYAFIFEAYGESEANDPAYSLKDMAAYIRKNHKPKKG